MLDGQKLKILFGLKVKELRIQNGYTQEQLAELIGLQPQTIATIETGRAFVSADVLSNICNCFNIEPSVLFSKKIEYPSNEQVNYINEIKRMLPSFSAEKLREIFNILLALKK